MADTRLQQLAKTDRNPIEETEYQTLLKQQPQAPAAQAPIDPVEQAQKLNQFYIQQNQPAIQNMQASIDPTKKRYDDLIASIKGQGQAALSQGSVAENYAQQSTATSLGRRGLLPQSEEGQMALSNALLPVQSQNQANQAGFANLIYQAGLGENSDLNTINNAIGQLQSGQPANAVGAALQYGGQVQQANQFQQSLALQQQQQQLAQQAQSFNQRYITIPNVGLYDTQQGQYVGGAGGASIGALTGPNGLYKYTG